MIDARVCPDVTRQENQTRPETAPGRRSRLPLRNRHISRAADAVDSDEMVKQSRLHLFVTAEGHPALDTNDIEPQGADDRLRSGSAPQFLDRSPDVIIHRIFRKIEKLGNLVALLAASGESQAIQFDPREFDGPVFLVQGQLR